MASEIRHTWSESDRFVARTFVRPMQRFMGIEAAGGIVMMLAAVAAIIWANSPWSEGYEDLFAVHVDLSVGGLIHLELTLQEWINDGLMVLFFFVVGLEIKRELVVGELRDPRTAGLPVVAAVGGMLLPALIYRLFNGGGEAADGWGIPMATDIAFAVGVVSLLGRRVPPGAKLFLLTLAIVDDLGAIAVIAVFYTTGLSLSWLAIAAGTLIAAWWLNRISVRSLAPYIGLGIMCWYALHESGVHTTITGVAFGLLCPTWSFYDPALLPDRARGVIDRIDMTLADGKLSQAEYERDQAHLDDLGRLARETQSPLDRIEHRLAPWTGFVVVPVFAFANAGVALGGASIGDVALGVALGLVVGKTLGIVAATWIAVRLGLGRLPESTTWTHLFGVALCAGIGFTVALFVADLSFDDHDLIAQAKIGILLGSAIAGICGYAWLRFAAGARSSRAPGTLGAE